MTCETVARTTCTNKNNQVEFIDDTFSGGYSSYSKSSTGAEPQRYPCQCHPHLAARRLDPLSLLQEFMDFQRFRG